MSFRSSGVVNLSSNIASFGFFSWALLNWKFRSKKFYNKNISFCLKHCKITTVIMAETTMTSLCGRHVWLNVFDLQYLGKTLEKPNKDRFTLCFSTSIFFKSFGVHRILLLWSQDMLLLRNQWITLRFTAFNQATVQPQNRKGHSRRNFEPFKFVP